MKFLEYASIWIVVLYAVRLAGLIAFLISFRRLELGAKKDIPELKTDILKSVPGAIFPKRRLFESYITYIGRLIKFWEDGLIAKWGPAIMEDGRTFKEHIEGTSRYVSKN